MNIPKIFILSLPDATARRQSANNQCKQYNLPFEWIDAYDFREVARDKISHYYQPTNDSKQKNELLTNTEIACALGHQDIYRKIIYQQIPYSLILEDDFKFIENPLPLLNSLESIQKNIDFDVLLLGYVKMLEEDLSYHYRRLPIKKYYSFLTYDFGKPWQQFSCGTVGYIVTLNGAKKLLSNTIKVTADDWLYFERKKNTQILHIRPFLILESCEEFPSDIRQEKDNYLTIKRSSYLIRSLKGDFKNLIMNKFRCK